jgi:Mg/Co/Ni transporter MgtE
MGPLVTEKPAVVRPDASLQDLLEVVAGKDCTTQVYVVNEEGKLCGTVPLDRLVAQLFPLQGITEDWSMDMREGPRFGVASVQEIMDLKPRYVTRSTPVGEMARSMMRERVTELPVVDDRMVLLGVVGVRSAVRGYLRMDSAPTPEVESPSPVAAMRKMGSSLG